MIGNAFPMSASAMTGGAPRATGAAAGPSPAASNQGASGDDSRVASASPSARTVASTNATNDNTANKSANTDGSNVETPATGAAASRDAAQNAKVAGDEHSAMPSDFAALLEASAVTASSAAPAPALVVSTETSAPAATDPAAQAGLPDQLLALLNGSWALPSATASSSAQAEAALPAGTAMPALPTLANALPANAAAASAVATATTPVAATAPAAPALGVPPNAAGSGAFAALNEIAAASTRAAGDTAGALEAATAIDSSTPDPTALAATAPTLAPTRASAPAPTAAIVLPADPDAGFDDAFGGRIAWMAEQRIGHAEIRISPEHLGPIDVRIQLDGTRVSAEFHSAHAEVRHALESSVTRLRDLLGQHGLQLSQADVGQRQSGQGQAARRDGDGSGHGATAADGRAQSDAGPRLRSRGLLDEYA